MFTSSRQHFIAAALAILVLAVAGVVIAGAFGAAAERVLTVFFISLIAVTGIGVYSGNSGILSFGHVAFMGIGAYISGILTLPTGLKTATLRGLPDWLAATELTLIPAIAVAVLATAVIALLIGVAIGRLEGSAASIATLGLLVIVHGVIIGWRDVTRGAQSFFGVPRDTTLIIAATACVIALVAARWYRDSLSGLRLRAGRENAIAAKAVGVNVQRERLVSWVLSAAIMALSGALIAHFLGAFSPKKFYFHDTFLLLAMLIVGGMTTVTGAISGTILITVITEILRRFESGLSIGGLELPAVFGTTQIGIGLLILFAMFRMSEGVTGLKEWEERVFPFKPKRGDAEALGKRRSDERLQVEHVAMQFGGLRAVDDVSISVNPGEILGLIGPNGSGKTTLLNVISGILKPTEGDVVLGDKSLTGIAPEKIADYGIARTFQNIRLFPTLTVYQNVLTAALSTRGGQNAEERAGAALVRLGIEERAGRDAGTLSYGEQRRVEIARALACEPTLLLLDEPAAGMNREETDDLIGRLKTLSTDLGLGVVLVDHDLKLINELCDRIVVLNEGKLIADGAPAAIRENPAVIEAYLGPGKAA
ncbi:branched-chain amino acid ABC transporter ATP-binding protein/permease [uncultured Nitratireductor sp.]|uniref:branched-chain amino acid ABC transporter ATP-binding protein/permease n=1 Tax=uncultured Nitratireductor sp. TaxID=520953 RepID=UPI0025F4DEF7|nr:branched-chain amino acid ABC transporter ATP-binding protein/permease [uncultured Nitratireductor sp.]